MNKKDGEKAGLESSLSSLQEELNILRNENEEMVQIRITETRKNREMSRELELLKSAIKIEKEETDSILRSKAVSMHTGGSLPSTPGGPPVASKYPPISCGM